jgi:hypothetical protein
MTLWLAILAGSVLGGTSGAGWWFWQIREPRASVEKTLLPEATTQPSIPPTPEENIVTKPESEPEKRGAKIKKPRPTVSTEQNSKGPNSPNVATYGDNSPVTINPTTLPPPLTVSRLTYTQEQVSSSRDEAPYAVKVVVQTSVPLQPTSIAVKCNVEVAANNWRVVGSSASSDVGEGYVGDKSVFWVYFGAPVFKPETPLIILLMAKEPIRVLGVGYGPPPPGH